MDEHINSSRLIAWLLGGLATTWLAAGTIWIESNGDRLNKLDARAQAAEVRIVTLESRYERIDEKLSEIQQGLKDLKVTHNASKRRTEE